MSLNAYYQIPEISRGRRLLTGALIGMAAGVVLGYALGRYAPGSDPQWPARFECRDVGGMAPGMLRICTPVQEWNGGLSDGMHD